MPGEERACRRGSAPPDAFARGANDALLIVGVSRLGRPIEAVELGDRAIRLLVFGAIHGDEPDSGALCRRFITEWQSSTKGGVLVLPVVNPDGLAIRDKNNARGVDLNRNFPARSFCLDHCAGYHPGLAPLSEPESAVLHQLVERAAPRAIVSVHQPFACINWDGPAAPLAVAMGAVSALPLQPNIGYPTPGSFGSFYGVDRQLPVVTMELSRAPSPTEFRRGLDALEAALAWTLSP